ncbi:MAG: hypothetical protein KKE17_12060 [Proteobacteria bacterium]|nr:hypothetical protein [Pseudomonadota bacterium]MBU1710731.1 hypothetical protein [Pseudomonadota bacterium]
MNTTATRTKTNEAITTQAGIDAVTKGSIAIMGSASALIGLWAVACIITAAFTAGPLGLARGWFSAVAGM